MSEVSERPITDAERAFVRTADVTTADEDSTIILTVTSSKVGDDPPIRIFHTELQGPKATWKERFGSAEQLQAYLKGLNSAYSQIGRFPGFGWDIPAQWTEPSGMRWTVPPDGLTQREELNSDGEVITI